MGYVLFHQLMERYCCFVYAGAGLEDLEAHLLSYCYKLSGYTLESLVASFLHSEPLEMPINMNSAFLLLVPCL